MPSAAAVQPRGSGPPPAVPPVAWNPKPSTTCRSRSTSACKSQLAARRLHLLRNNACGQGSPASCRARVMSPCVSRPGQEHRTARDAQGLESTSPSTASRPTSASTRGHDCPGYQLQYSRHSRHQFPRHTRSMGEGSPDVQRRRRSSVPGTRRYTFYNKDVPKRPADYTTRPQPVIKENG